MLSGVIDSTVPVPYGVLSIGIEILAPRAEKLGL